MRCTPVRLTAGMLSGFREPMLHLGVQATEVMSAFYKALQPTQQLHLRDLQTFGGNTYGDLRLSINTFAGGGRIDIRADALVVDLNNVMHTDYGAVAKGHMALCEGTLLRALPEVGIRERHMRASLWLACEGGAPAVESFLAEKGNAALKMDHGPYAALKKEFTIQFDGLDVSKGAKVGLALQRSTAHGDLFVQFDHTLYGSPVVTQMPEEQFDQAESEFQNLMLHVGLEVARQDA